MLNESNVKNDWLKHGELAVGRHREGMVLIPGGPFIMGSVKGSDSERPVHEVVLDEFWMDSTPVTNSEFARFAELTGYRTSAEIRGKAWGLTDGRYTDLPGLCWRTYATPDRENHPVVFVSWEDASSYARWAGKRLPTEAEWEKAARGGLLNANYPWGDADPDGSQCNFAKAPLKTPPTTSVMEFPPNGYGLYDMVGNVWQWCIDYFAEDYYLLSPNVNPSGPQRGLHRVRRGGSWNVIQPFRLRCANRGAMDPFSAVPNLGFRCVAPIKGYK